MGHSCGSFIWNFFRVLLTLLSACFASPVEAHLLVEKEEKRPRPRGPSFLVVYK